MKTCTKCGEAKPTTEFQKDASHGDGLSSHCKACRRIAAAARYAENPGPVRSRVAKWKADNPGYSSKWNTENAERNNAKKAKHYTNNREVILAGKAAYRADRKTRNPSELKASDAKSNAANPGKRKALKAKWDAANPEASRVYKHNRRARKLEAGGKLSKGLAERLYALQRGKCTCCGKPLGKNYHLDHIMPLVLGGPNTDDNIQLLRAKCNLQKHAAHPVDFMQQRGFLL